MSEIQGIGRFKFHEGNLEEFKRLSAQAIEIARTKDTGTLQYEIYFSDDQSEAIVLERYRNSAAIIELPDLSHLVALREQASVLGQCEAGDFAERRRENPPSERFSSERRAVVVQRLLESLFTRNGSGTALDLRQIARSTARRREEARTKPRNA